MPQRKNNGAGCNLKRRSLRVLDWVEKPPRESCSSVGWNGSSNYLITKLPQFPDHPLRADPFGLSTDGRTSLLVAHTLMQNDPKHPAESMRHRPDRWLVSHSRQ